jgi:hypothetical protein
MSFVAFAANYAGTPPAPFRPFAAGEHAYYLVGVETANGHPAPSGQLSVFKDKTQGEGRDPVDTMVETAKGWRGRRRVAVATRTYTWERFSRGALAVARDSAQWTDPTGQPLRLWAFVVAVDDAQDMGYRVPRGRMNARAGSRGVGHENNARGTVRGRSVVQATPPAPVVPTAPTTWATASPVTSAVCGRRLPYSRLACDQPSGHRGACANSVPTRTTAPVDAAIAALTTTAPVVPTASTVDPASTETADPSIVRFRLLDLSDDGPTAPVVDSDDGPGRVPMID